MKVGYARVSTQAQDTRRQDAALTAAGCERIYMDKWTGNSAIRGREGGRQMDDMLREGQDRVVVTELARAGRRASALLTWLDDLERRGIEFEALSENILIIPGEDNMVGRLLVSVCSAVAEMDRQVLLSRAAAGRKEALAAGVRFGRPEKLDAAQKKALVRSYTAARNEGGTATASARETSRVFGVSPRTVFRVVADAENQKEKVAA